MNFRLPARLIVAALVAIALVAGPSVTTPPVSAAPRIVLPPANRVFDYQLGGAYKPASNVAMVIRDRTESPATGKYNVCYVNAFQTQPGESAAFAKKHPSLLVKRANGRPLVDPNWPDEYIFDISTSAKRTKLAKIVGGWIDGCAEKGFDAVEADNLDSYLRSNNRLTESHAIAFATLLVKRAHDAGLAIGQKNGAEFAATGKKKIGFNFAITEECEVYRECGEYTRAYGNQVYEVEYSDNGKKAYARACAAQGAKISVVYRDRDVVPKGSKGYINKNC